MPIKQLSGALLAAAAVTLLASSAAAQGPDARVLPRGVLELRVMGTYTQFTDRYGPDGLTPLGAALDALIAEPATRLAQLQVDSVEARLQGFYTRTQARTGGATPLGLQTGTPRALLSADFRDAPVTLALGVSSRITLELTASAHRRGTVVRGFLLDGATLGVDPDDERNSGILFRADSAYARTVGRYLPLRGTPAGDELQRRVLELTGDTLTLPTRPVPVMALLDDDLHAPLDSTEAHLLGAVSARSTYQLGDTYLGARVQLARSVNGWALPWSDSGSVRGFRAAVGGRVRFPTGARSATLFPLQFAPEGGHWGVSGDAAADWFLSRRWWVSAAGAMEVLFPTDVTRLAFSDVNPYPDTTQRRTLRLEPGARWVASLTPRYRLTREIAFAAHYEMRGVGEATLTSEDAEMRLGPIETTEARTSHAVGIGMSYSTLAAYQSGESPFPVEASVLYRNVVAGNGYEPHAGSVQLTGRIYAPILWRARPARPTAPPGDTRPSIPAPDSTRTVRPDSTPAPRPVVVPPPSPGGPRRSASLQADPLRAGRD